MFNQSKTQSLPVIAPPAPPGPVTPVAAAPTAVSSAPPGPVAPVAAAPTAVTPRKSAPPGRHYSTSPFRTMEFPGADPYTPNHTKRKTGTPITTPSSSSQPVTPMRSTPRVAVGTVREVSHSGALKALDNAGLIILKNL